MSQPDLTSYERFREHRPGGKSKNGEARRQMPDDVGFIVDPTDGRQYLFEVEKRNTVALLAPQEEIDRGVEQELERRFGRVRRAAAPAATDEGRTEKVRPTAGEKPRVHPAPRPEKRRDEDRLEQAALKSAGMVKLFVDLPASSSPPQVELPDLVDWLRGDDRGGRPLTLPGGDDAGSRQTFQCFPHHVLTCQEYPEWGPAGPAQPIPDYVPSVTGNAGRGLNIAVIDTGGRIDHKLLLGASESRPGIDHEDLDRNNDQRLDMVAGHGTFIAGIIRRLAPGANILIRSAANPNGTCREGLVAGALRSLLEQAKPIHFVNLSLGGYLHNDNGEGLQLTNKALKDLWARWPDMKVVAAAGNDTRETPFFPAARKDVIGVGALGPDGKRAPFSNFGAWVDRWAPGVGLRSSWVGPLLEVPGGGGLGTEGATWSGTSFATPMVVGALAAEMSPSG